LEAAASPSIDSTTEIMPATVTWDAHVLVDPFMNWSWVVIGQQGDRHTILLHLNGEPVGTIFLAALPDWPGADNPGVVPFWGVEDFTLP
jgi:hypothetical protein